MTQPGRVAVLASGGVDSAVLVADLARQGRAVQPLYVRFGLAWEAVEEAHLRRFLDTLSSPDIRPLVTLDLPVSDVYASHWSVSGTEVPDAESPDAAVYLPGRNLLLLAKSVVWCVLNGFEVIALGTLAGNPFADARPEFFAAAGDLVQMAMSAPLSVITPFAGMTKADVVERGHGLALEHTFSCISPRAGLHCGSCNKCAERQRVFAALGTRDTTAYAAV